MILIPEMMRIISVNKHCNISFQKYVKRKHIQRTMMSLSGGKEADIIEAFNSMFRYLDDLLNIGNTYFDGIGNQI